MYECNKCVQPSKSFSMIDVASSRHSLIWNHIVVPVAYSVSNLWNGSASSLDVREMRTASALINHAIINTVLTCFSFSFFAPPPSLWIVREWKHGKARLAKIFGCNFEGYLARIEYLEIGTTKDFLGFFFFSSNIQLYERRIDRDTWYCRFIYASFHLWKYCVWSVYKNKWDKRGN